jgi:predicted nucleotidyltransferase
VGDPEMLRVTGDPATDGVLRGFVGVCELLFPGRVRAYYLTGSWADGTAVRTVGDALHSSDVDLTVVFKGAFEAGEPERFRRGRAACEALSGLGFESLDATARDEATLLREGHASLGQACRQLSGEDVRAAVPLPTSEAHLQRAARLAIDLMAEQRGLAPGDLRTPLRYPDQGGEFYGYDFRDPNPVYGGHHGTRLLVEGVTWGATVLLVLETGQIAGSKRGAVGLFQQHLPGPRADLVAAVYERCKLRWRYQFPAAATERRALRVLCRRVLAFENHVLRQLRAHPDSPVWAPPEA